MIDLLFRCETRARWRTLAQNRGIYNAANEVQPGYDVDEIGFYEITAAIGDTPPVLDTWWTVNVRIAGNSDDDDLYPGETDTGFRFTKSKLVRFVRNQATQVTVMGMRAYQFGLTPNRVQIIDSRDLTPKRIWLGGMSF
jgi:hypothetical protein